MRHSITRLTCRWANRKTSNKKNIENKMRVCGCGCGGCGYGCGCGTYDLSHPQPHPHPTPHHTHPHPHPQGRLEKHWIRKTSNKKNIENKMIENKNAGEGEIQEWGWRWWLLSLSYCVNIGHTAFQHLHYVWRSTLWIFDVFSFDVFLFAHVREIHRFLDRWEMIPRGGGWW